MTRSALSQPLPACLWHRCPPAALAEAGAGASHGAEGLGRCERACVRWAQALAALRRARRLPELIVWDLDCTLWPFWCAHESALASWPYEIGRLLQLELSAYRCELSTE